MKFVFRQISPLWDSIFIDFRMSCAPGSRPRVSLKPNSHTKAYISKCLTSVVKGPRERSGFIALKASPQSYFAWPSVATIWSWLRTKKWTEWWSQWNSLIRFVTTNGLWRPQLSFSWTKRIYLNRRSSIAHYQFAFQNSKVKKSLRIWQFNHFSRENFLVKTNIVIWRKNPTFRIW